MTLHLHELASPYASLAEVLGDEEQPCDGDTLVAAVEAIQDEAAQKALSLAKVVKSLEAEVQILEEHTRLLQAKMQTRHTRIAFLRHVIRLQLEAAAIDRVRDPLVTVWLQASRPAVEVIDETAVPSDFMRAVLKLPYSAVPPELRGFLQHLDVDRAAILDQLRRTGEVPDGVVVKCDQRHIRIRA